MSESLIETIVRPMGVEPPEHKYKNTEIWKDIVGYEEFYLISNLGNVRSKSRMVPTYRGTRTVRGKQLKPIINKLRGNYTQISVAKVPGKHVTKRLHRLVALTFIPNPENKPEINHKNGIKTDNRVENLEWCTSRENTLHAHRIGLYKPYEKTKNRIKHITQLNNKHITPIVALSNTYKLLKIFVSQRAAGRYYNCPQILVRSGEIVNKKGIQFMRVADYIKRSGSYRCDQNAIEP